MIGGSSLVPEKMQDQMATFSLIQMGFHLDPSVHLPLNWWNAVERPTNFNIDLSSKKKSQGGCLA